MSNQEKIIAIIETLVLLLFFKQFLGVQSARRNYISCNKSDAQVKNLKFLNHNLCALLRLCISMIICEPYFAIQTCIQISRSVFVQVLHVM